MKIGSSYSFNPLVLPGSIFYLDVQDSQFFEYSGSDVTAFANQKSGVWSPVAANRPSRNATGINGLPALVSDGTEKLLSTEPLVAQGLNGNDVSLTVMAVMQFDTTGGIQAFCGFGSTAGNIENVREFGATNVYPRIQSRDVDSTAVTTVGNLAPDTNPHIVTFTDFGTGYLAYVDREGWGVASSSFDLGEFSSNTFGIFNDPRDIAGEWHFFTGRIGAVYVKRGAMTHEEWLISMDYFEERWNF